MFPFSKPRAYKSSRTPFPNLSTIDIWGCMNLCCQMFTNIPVLQSLDTSIIPPQVWQPSLSPDIARCALERAKLPLVEKPWSVCSGNTWIYVDSSRCIAFIQNLTLISKFIFSCHQSPWNKTVGSSWYQQKRGVWLFQKFNVM